MWRRLLNRIAPSSCRRGVFEPFIQDEFTHTIGGATLHLKARDDTVQLMDTGDSTGFGVWGSALVLANFLERNSAQRSRLRGANVIELGSGTGFVGMSCAALGAHSVTLTDRVMTRHTCTYNPNGDLIMGTPVKDHYLLDQLHINVLRNTPALASSKLQVMELEWGNEDHIQAALALSDRGLGFDIIVGSDLSYHADCVPPLINTIRSLSHSRTGTVLALPHRQLLRDPGAAVAAMAATHGLVSNVLHAERWFTVLELRLGIEIIRS